MGEVSGAKLRAAAALARTPLRTCHANVMLGVGPRAAPDAYSFPMEVGLSCWLFFWAHHTTYVDDDPMGTYKVTIQGLLTY